MFALKFKPKKKLKPFRNNPFNNRLHLDLNMIFIQNKPSNENITKISIEFK